MNVLHVVGSRSGFFRISPVFRALRAAGAERQVLVYAGHREDIVPQHTLLEELDLPEPDHVLGVTAGSSVTRTGRSVLALESIVLREAPDWIFAVGDVDAALAAALVGRKNGVPLAHLEAGLRAGNGSTPIEINRQLTDRLADALFVAERATLAHLVAEGIPAERIHVVGNTAADTVSRLRTEASELDLAPVPGSQEDSYVVGLLTQTDAIPGETSLEDFLRAMDGVAFETGRPTLIILDPPAAARVREHRLEPLLAPVTVLSAPSYLEMIALLSEAGVVVTNACEIADSAVILGIPSVALGDFAVGRTTTLGSTVRVREPDIDRLAEFVIGVLRDPATPPVPELWDGQAGRRIAEITMSYFMTPAV